VDSSNAGDPHASPVRPADGVTRTHDRLLAAFEVLLCSGIPTQIVIAQALTLAGQDPFQQDGFRPLPLFTLALVDSVVLVALILGLLHARGESPRRVFLGDRRARRETALGLMIVPALFVGVGLTMLFVRSLMPWLQNVVDNPFERMIRTPMDGAMFLIVAVVAGGLREEIQRAFLLHRFEQSLGGAAFGLVVVSAAFGAGHYVQGWDAAIATALLGFTWGLLYLKRRSIVAPVVSHAGYNSLQILQVMVLKEMLAG
jgi:membrane protease YdiL (CAAX protease family)